MFYYVEGKVALIEQSLCVIDCAGVGYACHTSQNTISQVKMGETARLYTYLYVREDIFDLYGFADAEELNCFKMLIGVSGVGPKAALAILSVAPPSRLALSIITGEEKLLTQAPGIGKKTAQRIVLELRDKMSKEQLESGKGSAVSLELPATGSAEVNHCCTYGIRICTIRGAASHERTGFKRISRCRIYYPCLSQTVGNGIRR